MREEVWKHKFVAALFAILRKETGLGEGRCFDMCFELVGNWWKNFASYDSPEAAAEAAFQCLKTS